MQWMGATRAQIDDGCLTMTFRRDAGRHHGVLLDVSDRPIGGQLARLGEVWQGPFKSSRGLGQPP
jgi:hypothetical protein